MGKGFQGAVLALMGRKEHRAEVVSVHELTQRMIRIDFRSEDLLREEGENPAAWVRAWFPDPDGGDRLHQRAYTIMHADPEAGTFSLAFVRHSPAGPATTWADAAAPGDVLVMQRLGGDGFRFPDPAPAGHLLIGDAASWPAISEILASLSPEAVVEVLMEAHHPADRELPFTGPHSRRVRWVDARDDSRALVEALQGHDYHGWGAWVAAETRATRLLRSALQLEHAQNRETMHAQAYWVRGRAMGRTVEVPESDPGERHGDEADAAAAPADPPAPAGPSATGEPGDARVLAPAKPALIIGGLATAVLTVLQLIPLLLFSELAMTLVSGGDRESLRGLALAGAVVLLLLTGLEALLIGLLHVHDATFAMKLRTRLLRKLVRLPLGWFRGVDAGDARTLLKEDVDSLHYLITHAIPDLVGAIIAPLAILVYLFTVDVRLALVLLLPVVCYLVVMGRQAKADKEDLARMLRWETVVAGKADRFIANQRTARIFGDALAEDLPATLAERNRHLLSWQRRSLPAKTVSLQLTRPHTMVGILCLAGAALHSAGYLDPVDLIPFLILGTSFGDRLVAASYAANGIREGMDAASELELFLTTPELRPASPAPAPTPSGPRGRVEFRAVDFSYRPGEDALHRVSAMLPAGTTTALVGPSGAGKSTMAALLARLWDPDSGCIRLDGRDIRDIPEEEFRRRVGVVLQDVQLVRGTIRDNILLGSPEAPEERIRRACSAAHVDEFVDSLPEGLDTPVDRGSLSGGQRQRVGIARVLVADPDVVVLDEALASADVHTERAVQDALTRLLADRTVLVIAHRMSTIADADHVIVLHDGLVSEAGPRERLLRAGGPFSRMIERNGRALA